MGHIFHTSKNCWINAWKTNLYMGIWCKLKLLSAQYAKRMQINQRVRWHNRAEG